MSCFGNRHAIRMIRLLTVEITHDISANGQRVQIRESKKISGGKKERAVRWAAVSSPNAMTRGKLFTVSPTLVTVVTDNQRSVLEANGAPTNKLAERGSSRAEFTI